MTKKERKEPKAKKPKGLIMLMIGMAVVIGIFVYNEFIYDPVEVTIEPNGDGNWLKKTLHIKTGLIDYELNVIDGMGSTQKKNKFGEPTISTPTPIIP